MKKMDNESHIEGLLYDHKLEVRESGPNSKNPGTRYITGTVDVATDDKLQNIVTVHYTYVTAVTSRGNNNATFGVLTDIIDGRIGTIVGSGVEKAGKVRIDSAIGLNEFYSNRSGEEELVSVKRNEGGFIHSATELASDENTRNTFKVDMVITKVTHIDGDPDSGTEDRAIVKGAIFDFRNALLPVEFTALSQGAMNYFEGLEASSQHPVFTKVWGRQVSTTIVHKTVMENAFGEDEVRETRRSRKDYVITGASKDPFIWDDESTITAQEFAKAISDREIYLATLKQRNDEYQASRNVAVASASTATKGGFNF